MRRVVNPVSNAAASPAHMRSNTVAARLTKEQINARLRAERDAGGIVYDALCGTGITAKMAARGGADMVTTHILAYFRMQGLSSMAGYLPIGDANAITLELCERSLLNVVSECPVMAGLLCVDPTRDMRAFVDRCLAAGVTGIMNCPTVALIDGKFRGDLEETGTGYDKEINLLGYASSKGAFTKAFVTTVDEALAMAEAGIDNIIVHFGNSSGGTIGSATVLDQHAAAERTASVIDALQAKHSNVIVTCHGGSIETPEDFESFLKNEPRLDGYVGGSSAERFPIEESVPRVTANFKSVKRPKAN
jgi:predicted TIM-barrel enzyme